MAGHRLEIPVCRQKAQSVSDRQPGVDGPDLDSAPPAVVPQGRRLDVVLQVGSEDRQQ